MSISSVSPVSYPIYSLRAQLDLQEKIGASPLTEQPSLAVDAANNANGKELPQDYAVSDKKDTSKLVQTAEEAKAAAKAKNDKAIADFNAYMEKSPMEKYVEAWLEQHGISKEKFESMTPEEQKNILAQIKEDFEREAKLAAEKKGQVLNIVA